MTLPPKPDNPNDCTVKISCQYIAGDVRSTEQGDIYLYISNMNRFPCKMLSRIPSFYIFIIIRILKFYTYFDWYYS